MFPTTVLPGRQQQQQQQQKEQQGCGAEAKRNLFKRINDDKDVIHFKTKSPAYGNIIAYVDLLCERIQGTGNKIFNHKYQLQYELFKKCSNFLDRLEKCCDETDLNLSKGASTLRFGHVAFRDWFDSMKKQCEQFVSNELAKDQDDQFKDELFTYLSESFGNRMRIDYGTGHELNFIIFTMGLSALVNISNIDLNKSGNDGGGGGGGDDNHSKPKSNINPSLIVRKGTLKTYVETYGWDIHSLFTQNYLRLCRKIQTKFRLEPAGSRGVYNMDDFQYLPFLFGSAQLIGSKHITTSEFYLRDEVDQYKDDYIFFEAVDFILNNKRGPFNEHSYTLWGFTNLGSWDNIFRRIRSKFTDNILGPFPIIQHFLFGQYILTWTDSEP